MLAVNSIDYVNLLGTQLRRSIVKLDFLNHIRNESLLPLRDLFSAEQAL